MVELYRYESLEEQYIKSFIIIIKYRYINIIYSIYIHKHIHLYNYFRIPGLWKDF